MKYICPLFLLWCISSAAFAQRIKGAEVPANIRTVVTHVVLDPAGKVLSKEAC